MSSVPEDLYPEILLRLPRKSLLRCKCVCKSWFQIVCNPNFVKMHLDIITQTKNYNLIFSSYDERKRCWAIRSVSYDSIWSLSGSGSETVEMADYPFSSIRNLRFLGSCKGLVCMLIGCKDGNSVCFCNPLTKESLALKTRHVSSSSISAFGYDFKEDDYKLVILNRYEFLVYKLGSKIWQCSYREMHYKFANKAPTGTLVNGVFHWLGQASRENSSKLIVVFNISSEKFNELQLPKELLEKKYLSISIGVLEGCLCALVTVSEVCFKIWVMQDYGVQKSWTKRYSFERDLITADYDASKLMMSFRDGQILLRNGYKVFIYDAGHPKGRKPRSLSSLRLLDSIDYVESLVSPNSGTYAGNKKMEGEDEKNGTNEFHSILY